MRIFFTTLACQVVLGACALAIQTDFASAQEAARRPAIREAVAEVNGIQFHYRTLGSGPPLLLLHGFSGAGSWWDPLLEDLSQEHTLIIPDLPLHGRSTGRPGPYLYREVSADLFALLDQFGIDRFQAVGYSAGGIILLHMATQRPQRIKAMSLISTAHVLTEPNRATLRGWPAFEDMPEATRAYWLDVHAGGEDQVRTLLAALRGMADGGDNMDFTPEELSRIEARTLLVVGDRDALVPLELALEMYRAIPNAALWVVPGEGHAPVMPNWGGSLEARQIFPGVMRDFLSRSGDPSGESGRE